MIKASLQDTFLTFKGSSEDAENVSRASNLIGFADFRSSPSPSRDRELSLFLDCESLITASFLTPLFTASIDLRDTAPI